jgi:Peptidase family C25
MTRFMRESLFCLTLFWPVVAAVAAPASAAERSLFQADERREMVIVAPERFHKALAKFVAYRTKQRPTKLVSVESILRTTEGADDPERLKRWLYRGWKEQHLRYVLLVGDADIMPMRYMVLDRATPAAYDYAFYPSDLYYADVARRDGSFDDWNVRKDGFHASYFGEVRGEKNKKDAINFDQIDYRAELAVGRWPVDSVAEVELLAEKTITQDRANVAATGKAARNAAFVYVPGWVDARRQMDQWAEKLPKGWQSSKLYGGGPKTASPDERHVTGILNEGTALVLHVGHGEDNGWVHSLNVGTLPHLRNAGRLPVVLSAGCSTARFATLPPYEAYEDIHGVKHAGTNAGEVFSSPPPPPSPYARGHYNNTGLGELMVRRGTSGAVAYIGCNTGGQPCGLTLLEGFVRSLHDLPEPTLGDCWAGAINYYYEAEHLGTIVPNQDWYPPSIFFQGMKYMVYGDPALSLPRPH